MNKYFDLIKLTISIIIAYVALIIILKVQLDLPNLDAKGQQNSSKIEYIKGKPFTAFNVLDIKSLLDSQITKQSTQVVKTSSYSILWLGNSQLHFINQYKVGDHLSPYWLKTLWTGPISIEPLGCSLPNADYQEYLVISRYAQMKKPIQLIIMGLVFDKLREDGVRNDFTVMLSPTVMEQISKTSLVARDILERFASLNKQDISGANKGVLSGSMQEPVEKFLNEKLAKSWTLWGDRPQIEGNILVGLYYLRNYVFGIKPTTIRKMIPARYESNMTALKDILSFCQRNNIAVLLYIAPIRQDKPIPYNISEYSLWKKELVPLSEKYGASLVNLEKLVPGNFWGTYTENDVDFMHFQGQGHRMVAEALIPYVRKIFSGGVR